MPDVFSRDKRSQIMSRVKGSGNVLTEQRLARVLGQKGISGWRRRANLFGRPDFVFPKARLAVFVDGCFWHGCKIHGSRPKTNQKFWAEKLQKNKTRDQVVNRALRKRGWKVVRIWQHELAKPTAALRRVTLALKSPRTNRNLDVRGNIR